MNIDGMMAQSSLDRAAKVFSGFPGPLHTVPTCMTVLHALHVLHVFRFPRTSSYCAYLYDSSTCADKAWKLVIRWLHVIETSCFLRLNIRKDRFMMDMESGMGNSAALVISLQTGSTGGPSDDRLKSCQNHIYGPPTILKESTLCIIKGTMLIWWL